MSYANLTWGSVLHELESVGGERMSNRQLAQAIGLNSDEAKELSHLTRIMAKAGAIVVEPRQGSIGVNVYRSKL